MIQPLEKTAKVTLTINNSETKLNPNLIQYYPSDNVSTQLIIECEKYKISLYSADYHVGHYPINGTSTRVYIESDDIFADAIAGEVVITAQTGVEKWYGYFKLTFRDNPIAPVSEFGLVGSFNIGY